MATKQKLKIVLDTNMFLSGILYQGMIKIVLDLILDNKLKLYVSQALIEEVTRKLQEFGANKQSRDEVNLFLDRKGVKIKPDIKITVCRDPEDNFILELGQSSMADYIITRDKDLLDLPRQKWKSTKIMKPENFLPILRKVLPQRSN